MSGLNSKPFFQRMFRPIAHGLGRHGVTANQVTVTAMAASALAGATVMAFPVEPAVFFAVPVALLVRLVCNHVDGMIARDYGSQSKWGCVLNEQGDVFCDAVLYLPLATVAGVSAPLVIIAVAAAFMAEFTGVLGSLVGPCRRDDGPMAKKPRGVAFGGIYLALACGVPTGPWVDSTLVIVNLLLALTLVRRTVGAVGEAAP